MSKIQDVGKGNETMRFSTYLNNAKCMEWKINAQQGILFALLYEAPAWAKEEIIENRTYYFVSRNLILEELPMFFEKSDTVYRNLKVLQEKGLIEYIKQGKKDLIKITVKGKTWNEFKENNSEKNPTNNNTIYNYNNTNILNNIYSSVIDYLNEKTERTGKEKYSSTSTKTQKLIKARLREKYELEDFKTVIDKKCKEWLGTDMEKYLRPETLFGNKFESYLKQKTGSNKSFNTHTNQKTGATIKTERPKVTAEGLKKYFGGAN